MEFAMQPAAWAAGGVHAQHALGSGVPRRLIHGYAHAGIAPRARTTCAHHSCLICTNLDVHQVYELLSLVVLLRWQEAGEYKDDAHPLQHSMFIVQLIYCWGTTELKYWRQIYQSD